MSRKKQHTAQS